MKRARGRGMGKGRGAGGGGGGERFIIARMTRRCPCYSLSVAQRGGRTPRVDRDEAEEEEGKGRPRPLAVHRTVSASIKYFTSMHKNILTGSLSGEQIVFTGIHHTP